MSIAKWLLARKLSGGSPFPPVIKRKTGNPIELTDAAAAPLVKCVTEITGSQDLHGYDKPWVGGAGVNQCDPNAPYETFDLTGGGVYRYGLSFAGGNTYTIVNNSTSSGVYYRTPKADLSDRGTSVQVDIGTYITVNVPADCILWVFSGLVSNWQNSSPNIAVNKGTVTTFAPYTNICPITAYTEGEIEVRRKNIFDGNTINCSASEIQYQEIGVANLKAGTYTISYTLNSTVTGSRNRPYYNKTGSSTIYSSTDIFTKGRGSWTVTIESDGEYTFRWWNQLLSASCQIVDFQLEKGNQPTTYEPYKGTTHTTNYPSAIYRGSEDVVNGEVTSEWYVIDLGDLNWFYDSTVNSMVATVSNAKLPLSNDVAINAVCSICQIIPASQRATTTGIRLYMFISAPDIYIRDSGYTSASDFKTDMTGQKFAYELATPTTSSVTPTNLPIRTLSGYNHIESSTGEMTIDYITDTYQNFVDTVESALPNTRKGGTKAMDVFLSLEKKDDKEEPKEEEIKEEVKK